jgi:spoIIIJ-associated protein
MEWIVTTGGSVDEAKELALDQLGVAAEDADFEVLAEPTRQLLGLRRIPAKVRARVTPVAPPPKAEPRRNQRRDNKGSKRGSSRSPQGSGNGRGDGRAKSKSASEGSGKSGSGRPKGGNGGTTGGQSKKSKGGNGAQGGGGVRGAEPGAKKRTRRVAGGGSGTAQALNSVPVPGNDSNVISEPEESRRDGKAEIEQRVVRRRTIDPAKAAGVARTQEEDIVTAEVSVEGQQAMVGEFLEGLARSFGIEASAETPPVEEDAFEVNLAGSNEELGLLIGPKGGHLAAMHEVTKTMLQRRIPGADRARIRVDVGGYRAQRRTALEGYVAELVVGVKDSGVEKGLEPMNSADRKVVHDAVNAVDGVRTISVGEEPRRRVVIVPDVQ